MRNIMILFVVLTSMVVVVNALNPSPEPVAPLGHYFQPRDAITAELDGLIAKSIQRQREINAQLDEALHIHAEATRQLRQLRNFHHNP